MSFITKFETIKKLGFHPGGLWLKGVVRSYKPPSSCCFNMKDDWCTLCPEITQRESLEFPIKVRTKGK